VKKRGFNKVNRQRRRKGFLSRKSRRYHHDLFLVSPIIAGYMMDRVERVVKTGKAHRVLRIGKESSVYPGQKSE
jgi:hypothetical protein